MTLPALYQIADAYRHAIDTLSDMELPPEAVANTLEALGGDLQVKATNVAAFVKNLEGLAAQIKKAEGEMRARREALERRAEHIRTYIKECMERAGIQKIDCPHFALAVRNNPPAVEILDLFAVPRHYMREPPPPPPPEPDKRKIAEAIKAGKPIRWATLKQNTRLEIK